MAITNNIKGALKRFFFPVAAVAVAVTAFAFIPLSLSASSASEQKPDETSVAQKAPAEKFCGWSSNGSCQSDTDCIASGCSSEVCQSVNESMYNTICQSGDCYDAELYSLRCGCKNNTCQWVN